MSVSEHKHWACPVIMGCVCVCFALSSSTGGCTLCINNQAAKTWTSFSLIPCDILSRGLYNQSFALTQRILNFECNIEQFLLGSLAVIHKRRCTTFVRDPLSLPKEEQPFLVLKQAEQEYKSELSMPQINALIIFCQVIMLLYYSVCLSFLFFGEMKRRLIHLMSV